MNIILNREKQPQVTVLPNEFITDYMVKADGEYVKIYLLLLHLIQNNTFTGIEQIADILEITQKDVIRAVRYWQCQGVIQIDKELEARVLEDTPENERTRNNVIEMKPTATTRQEVTTAREIQQPKEVQTAQGKLPVPKKEDLGAAILQEGQEELRHSIYMAEAYLGKPLTQTELNSFLYIDTALDFSPDLLEYLIEYCVSREKKNVRYMETVAISWYQNGIDTVEKAKNQSANYTQNVFGIMKAFGIANRNPGKVEMEYIRRWNKMGFAPEIIEEACSRTVLSAHQPSFPYANRILESWKQAGVKTLEDIQALDEKRHAAAAGSAPQEAPTKKPKNQFHNFEQRTYDYDALEEKLFHNS